MNEILGYAVLAAGVDMKRSPWMQFALQKFRTQQPASPTAHSDVFRFLDTVKDSSNPKLAHVQHWNHVCTSWCSGFVNWCLSQARYVGLCRRDYRPSAPRRLFHHGERRS
jgi:hypothetical protein